MLKGSSKKVIRKLTEHHDALRMVYREKNGEIIQHNRGLEDSVFDLNVYDLKTEKSRGNCLSDSDEYSKRHIHQRGQNDQALRV